MMIFVTRVFFSGGKQSNSIEAFDQETQAKKRWHSIIAADIDKDGVQYELVQTSASHLRSSTTESGKRRLSNGKRNH